MTWGPDRIGDEVRAELGRFGPAAGMPEILAEWPRAVGDEIARNAWPARLSRDGALHVHTASSAWSFELGQLAPTILARLRERLAEQAPTSLRFAVGNLPGPASTETDERASRRPLPGPHERARAAELTAAIEDEQLRELIARAAAASLARTV